MTPNSPKHPIRRCAEVLHLALQLGLLLGAAVTLVRGPLDAPAKLASLARANLNEFARAALLLLVLYLPLAAFLGRGRRSHERSSLLALALLLAPLFVVWMALMNVVELRINQLTRFLEPHNLLWNTVFCLGFVVLLFVSARLLALWSQKRLLADHPAPTRHLVGLVLLYVGANLGLPGELGEPVTTAPGAPSLRAASGREPTKPVATFRFDDHLADAEVHVPDGAELGRAYDFDDGAAPWVATDPAHVQLAGDGAGHLHLSLDGPTPGIEVHDLGLRADEVQSISLRMRADRGESFELWWRRAGEEHFGNKVGGALRGSGEFHTYDINTLNMRWWGGVIDALRLVPTNRSRAEVDLDFLHLRYRPVGTGSYQIGSELRQVLFAHAPAELGYPVQVPAGGLLTFGAGVSAGHANATTRFEVLVQSAGDEAPRSVYDLELDEKAWEDARVDLGAYAGQEVTLTLRATSERSNGLAFWSSPVLVGRGESRPPHVLIYLIDCMRADHASGKYGYSRDTAPNLAAFADEGAVFLNAYSQFTSTRPSISSMMTSQYYAAHRVTSGIHDRLSEDFDTLPELLRERGYGTVAFTDNGNVGPGSNLDQGLDQIFRNGMNLEWDMHDDELSSVLPWLQRRPVHVDRPLYLYLHTVEPHAPYVPPEPYYNLFREQDREDAEDLEGLYAKYGEYHLTASNFQVPEDDVQHMLDVYDGLIRLADDRFAKIVETLKEVGLYDDTILVVTADHGEVFNEHNNWEHHGAPYQGLTHVPLMVRYPPAIPAGTVVDANVQLIDIAPTLLDLVGAPPHPDHQGTSLMPLIRGEAGDQASRPIFSEGAGRIALVRGDWKFIVEGAPRTISLRDDWQIDVREPKEYSLGKRTSLKRRLGPWFPNLYDLMRIPRRELYDLAADPNELYNLAEADPGRADEMERTIERWIAVQDRIYAAKGTGAGDIEGLDPKVVAELESLGYSE